MSGVMRWEEVWGRPVCAALGWAGSIWVDVGWVYGEENGGEVDGGWWMVDGGCREVDVEKKQIEEEVNSISRVATPRMNRTRDSRVYIFRLQGSNCACCMGIVRFIRGLGSSSGWLYGLAQLYCKPSFRPWDGSSR